MEILDLYDDNFNLLGETIMRGNKNIGEGKNIMLSISYIVNEEGKFLIQKTSEEKGSLYSSTGGHVTHGENGLTTIVRELEEELNIKKDERNIQFITTFKYPTKSLVINVYLVKVVEEEISKIKIQEEEVSEVSWMSADEIMKLIDLGQFLETHAYIFKEYVDGKVSIDELGAKK